jgi:hypothetical protein
VKHLKARMKQFGRLHKGNVVLYTQVAMTGWACSMYNGQKECTHHFSRQACYLRDQEEEGKT